MVRVAPVMGFLRPSGSAMVPVVLMLLRQFRAHTRWSSWDSDLPGPMNRWTPMAPVYATPRWWIVGLPGQGGVPVVHVGRVIVLRNGVTRRTTADSRGCWCKRGRWPAVPAGRKPAVCGETGVSTGGFSPRRITLVGIRGGRGHGGREAGGGAEIGLRQLGEAADGRVRQALAAADDDDDAPARKRGLPGKAEARLEIADIAAASGSASCRRCRRTRTERLGPS